MRQRPDERLIIEIGENKEELKEFFAFVSRSTTGENVSTSNFVRLIVPFKKLMFKKKFTFAEWRRSGHT